MKVYGYSHRLRPANAYRSEDEINNLNVTAAPLILGIAKMWRKGFLPDDATVWINADMPELGMWVLAEESTHVYYHESIIAGWARITRTSVRLGTTWKNTVNRPIKEFRVGDTGLADIHSTVVLNHNSATSSPDRVQFVANSDIAKPVNAKVRFDPFTVVDLNYHTGPEKASTNPLVRADALLNGTRLMTYGADEDRVALVHDNVEAFCSEINPEELDKASQVNRRELGIAHRLFTLPVSNNISSLTDVNELVATPVRGATD